MRPLGLKSMEIVDTALVVVLLLFGLLLLLLRWVGGRRAATPRREGKLFGIGFGGTASLLLLALAPGSCLIGFIPLRGNS